VSEEEYSPVELSFASETAIDPVGVGGDNRRRHYSLGDQNMAEDKPGLHIDLDWKKQAQEEKKRLEEEEKKRAEERAAAQAAPPTPAGVVPAAVTAAASGANQTGGAGQRKMTRGGRELPAAGIPTLAQSLVTQALYYLGDANARGGDESANMDMAKHLIDTLGILEDKTQGHLTADEQQVLDTALYEARMRFIAVAGQVIAGA
jgi:hypothetical protein